MLGSEVPHFFHSLPSSLRSRAIEWYNGFIKRLKKKKAWGGKGGAKKLRGGKVGVFFFDLLQHPSLCVPASTSLNTRTGAGDRGRARTLLAVHATPVHDAIGSDG